MDTRGIMCSRVRTRRLVPSASSTPLAKAARPVLPASTPIPKAVKFRLSSPDFCQRTPDSSDEELYGLRTDCMDTPAWMTDSLKLDLRRDLREPLRGVVDSPAPRVRVPAVAARQVDGKVLVTGDSGVGKTSFVQRYVSERYDGSYKWTVGVDFALKVVHWSDTVTIKLQLWDIAGQERFTSMTRVYYRDAHACIIMFDLSQRASFLNALKWKQDLDAKCRLADGEPVPCVLLANKCDLGRREVEQSEIEAFCRAQGFIGWTETSVKDGLMVDESMRFLLDEMMQRYTDRNPDLDDSMEILNSSEIGGATINLTHTAPSGDSKNCAC